jgi:hypothetical protein
MHLKRGKAAPMRIPLIPLQKAAGQDEERRQFEHTGKGVGLTSLGEMAGFGSIV